MPSQFQRKLLQPAFKQKSVRDLYPTFWSETMRFTRILDNLTSGSTSSSFTPVDIFDWTSRATMDLITLTAFGGCYHSLENPDTELHQAWETFRFNDRRLGNYVGLWLILPFFIWTRLPVKGRQVLEQAADRVRTNAKTLIEARRRALSHDTNGSPPEGEKVGIDIISTILKSPQTFTDDQLTIQAITYVFPQSELLYDLVDIQTLQIPACWP